jgi:parallel beta-helix repeat protein
MDDTNGTRIVGCTARDMGDGAVLLVSTGALVVTAEKKNLRILVADGVERIQKGDSVELMSFTGEPPIVAKVADIKADGNITDEEISFVKTLPIHPDLKNSPDLERLKKAMTLRLDREIKLPRGSLVLAASRACNGFVIKGNRLGPIPAVGVYVRASSGSISSNTFVGCRESIRSSPDYSYFSGGTSSGLVIENNTIEDNVGSAIIIEAYMGDGAVASAGAHQNIRIVGNTITNSSAPGIVVGSTRGAVLTNNKLRLHPAGSEQVGIRIFNSENVLEKDNHVEIEASSLSVESTSPTTEQ